MHAHWHLRELLPCRKCNVKGAHFYPVQGAEEGGSGVPLDKLSYRESVKYWQEHAPIVAGQKPGVA